MALIPRPTLVAFGHARTSLNVDADFMLNSYAFGVELRQCLRINGTVRGGIRTPESLGELWQFGSRFPKKGTGEFLSPLGR